MAGPNADVSTAKGDLFAVLLYGKYGYDLDSFISQSVAAAAELNKQQPGCVSQDLIDGLVSRIKNEEEDEADALRRQFATSVSGHDAAPTADEVSKILGIYDRFHDQRQAIFADERSKGTAGFQMRFACRLKSVLMASLSELPISLGKDRYNALFSFTPDQAASFLINCTR